VRGPENGIPHFYNVDDIPKLFTGFKSVGLCHERWPFGEKRKMISFRQINEKMSIGMDESRPSVTVFCLIYIVVAVLLAYRLAPKTFHLRQ
jgi:hypothetical protein